MSEAHTLLLDAMKDPAAREAITDMIASFRPALAGTFEAAPDTIPMNQSYAISAAALFAGMTVGHMIALGVLRDGDRRRAGQAMLANFRVGIEFGKDEARTAMLQQTPPHGHA
jgi:hypothetical protein